MLLEKLMANVGRSNYPQYAKEDRGARGFVRRTPEFERIKNLPRRKWEDENLSPRESRDGKMSLWPAQAAALYECGLFGGAFCPIGVGQGKALISLLAPVIMQALRPVLFVPAQLREQTLTHVIPEMKKHWRLHPGLRVIGYSELSLEKNKDMLVTLNPDLIILDECHMAKNRSAGRTRRLVRWFREHPETKCVAMSGTISKRSLKDFAHIIDWCLGPLAPLPRRWPELQEWALAIDEGIEDEARYAPGVLGEFCNTGENVRQGYCRRLTETPGVIATKESAVDASIQITRFPGLAIPEPVGRVMDHVRRSWETPDGDPILQAVDLWRHMRELALGFWYRWEPAPPKRWLDARRVWKQYVREVLKHNRRGLDTELQVWKDCDDLPERRAWDEVKDEYHINTVPEWISDFALRAVDRWSQEGGIIWVEHTAVGEALHGRGLSYFGAGDDAILMTTAPAIVASIGAHSTGKNLQRYSRNLVVSPMTSGLTWEQMMGRTHRAGQLADTVTFDVFLHCEELEASFERARSDARYQEETFGNRQKLNFADIAI